MFKRRNNRTDEHTRETWKSQRGKKSKPSFSKAIFGFTWVGFILFGLGWLVSWLIFFFFWSFLRLSFYSTHHLPRLVTKSSEAFPQAEITGLHHHSLLWISTCRFREYKCAVYISYIQYQQSLLPAESIHVPKFSNTLTVNRQNIY